MSMRYLIRRENPSDLDEIKQGIPNLDEQLGTPIATSRKYVKTIESASRSILYTFLSRKNDAGFEWICPSKELIGESEADLLDMAKSHSVTDLSHIHK